MTNTQDPIRRIAEAVWIILEDANAGDNAIDSITLAIRDHTVVPELIKTLTPFAKLLHPHHRGMRDGDPFFQVESALITIGDLRKANNILVKARGEG